MFLFIRSLEVTWFYFFVWGSMPSLVSSTAKERLQLLIMTFYLLSLVLVLLAEVEPADKSVSLM